MKILRMYVKVKVNKTNIKFRNSTETVLDHIREDIFGVTRTYFNNLSANPTTWSNTIKQFVGKLLNL